MKQPQIRYSSDGESVAVKWDGDEYWYRFDHAAVDASEYADVFRCMPGTFDDDPAWLHPDQHEDAPSTGPEREVLPLNAAVYATDYGEVYVEVGGIKVHRRIVPPTQSTEEAMDLAKQWVWQSFAAAVRTAGAD